MLREIRLKEIKSRWGSCSAKGGVSISWRPIMAPAEVFDYLLIHELCHLLERGHTPRFWAEVEKRCPEHRAARRYLREKHFELTNFPIPLGPAKTFARFAPR
jgi:predicted metal-dependent hydrolase